MSDRFVFPKETTNSGLEYSRKQRNGYEPAVNEKVPSQNEKRGLAEQPPNSLSRLHERLLRISQ